MFENFNPFKKKKPEDLGIKRDDALMEKALKDQGDIGLKGDYTMDDANEALNKKFKENKIIGKESTLDEEDTIAHEYLDQIMEKINYLQMEYIKLSQEYSLKSEEVNQTRRLFESLQQKSKTLNANALVSEDFGQNLLDQINNVEDRMESVKKKLMNQEIELATSELLKEREEIEEILNIISYLAPDDDGNYSHVDENGLNLN